MPAPLPRRPELQSPDLLLRSPVNDSSRTSFICSRTEARVFFPLLEMQTPASECDGLSDSIVCREAVGPSSRCRLGQPIVTASLHDMGTMFFFADKIHFFANFVAFSPGGVSFSPSGVTLESLFCQLFRPRARSLFRTVRIGSVHIPVVPIYLHVPPLHAARPDPPPPPRKTRPASPISPRPNPPPA